MRARTPLLGCVAAALLALPAWAQAITVGDGGGGSCVYGGSCVANTYYVGPTFAVATQPFTVDFGTVDPCPDLSSWSVQVNWMDGTVESVPLAQDPSAAGSCTVRATHTYAPLQTGQIFDPQVTEVPANGGITRTVIAPVNVRPWSVDNVQPAKSKDLQLTWRLFSFTDSGISGTYLAHVDWGDGTTSDVPAVQGWVEGTHRYPAPGTYAVHASLLRDGAEQAAVDARAVISDCADPQAAAAYAPPPGARSVRWLYAVYHDLLGHDPDGAAIADWTASGMSRTAIVKAVQASDEYRAALVQQTYQLAIGRSATDEEMARLGPGRLTSEQALSQVARDGEYWNMLRNEDTAAFFDAFVCDAMHRPSSPTESAASRLSSRDDIVANVLSSIEYRQRMVNAVSLRLLREPSSAITDPLLRYALDRATTVQDAEVAIASSRPYYELMAGPPDPTPAAEQPVRPARKSHRHRHHHKRRR